MPSLLSLPNELIQLVACGLDLQSLLNFRLASSRLNGIALPTILKRCFETRYVMLQQRSIENLLEISRHPVYGPALKTLTICIDHLIQFPEYSHILPRWGDTLRMYREGDLIPRVTNPSVIEDGKVDDIDGGGGEEEDAEEEYGEENFVPRAAVNGPTYTRLLEDQKYMMESGLNTIYLAQAMAALPNLKTVVVHDAFKPWGATALERQTGAHMVNSLVSPESIEFVTQTLCATVIAIAISSISLDELHIAVGQLDYGINPDMLAFPRPVLRYIQSHPINLTSLNLSVSPPNRAHPQDRVVGDLLGFIALFPGLKRLSFEFSSRCRHEHFSLISQSLRIPGLRYLGISGVDCTEGELLPLLLGHKDSLEEVEFSVVNMIPGGGTWQSLLAMVRDELTLQVLSMTRCMAAERRVCCRESESDGAPYLEAFEISGTRQDWTEAVKDIVIRNTEDLGI